MIVCLFMAGSTGWSQTPDPETMKPVIQADWVQMGCSYYLRIEVTPQSPPPGFLYLSIWKTEGHQVYYNPNFPRNTVVFIEAQANATTNYSISATDDNEMYCDYPQRTTITITPPCVINSMSVTRVENPGTQTAACVAYPNDPNEVQTMSGMQVRWKLEEIDVQTFQPVFTLDNPPAWENCNRPGASNAFNGFNAFVETSVAELQAGAASTNPGVFDAAKVYRVTRFYKLPGDNTWTSSTDVIGYGDDDRDGGDRPRKKKIKSTKSLNIQTDSEVLKVGMDVTNQIAIFHTPVNKGRLIVYDLSGKQLAVILLEEGPGEYELSVSGFAKGAYIVKMESGSQLLTRKFVVE
jgi:hypothetical protein